MEGVKNLVVGTKVRSVGRELKLTSDLSLPAEPASDKDSGPTDGAEDDRSELCHDCTRKWDWQCRVHCIRDVIGHPPYSHGAREIGGSHE